MPIHLVIHGHFYQPPRENPWTGVIERQPSAAPHHDWNARIAAECYEPNRGSAVLDEHGRVEAVVNNYERLSFNFGPTLLAWLARAAPGVRDALLAADAASLARLGHGNAIAQSYNHMILPLATPRDRMTQIRWGMHEFEHRFGRRAEAMWLAETAVDRLTLELLARAGLRYVILSPAQAVRWRPRAGGPWVSASEAELDPRRPYRWRLRDTPGEPAGELGLDVCFYHAPLSRGVSFQHYLKDARLLAQRIQEAAGDLPDPLVLIATDGESFGHHERFGDMCLATLFMKEAPARGVRLSNLAAYLDEHPPAWEVELARESAWSCSHGVGRWREDCGCSTGGGPGWTQAWRRPLRHALDRLRDALGRIFEEEGAPLLRDPWAARDAYIALILDRSPAARDAFFAAHQARPLAAEERARALRLLEMQHQAMLMYTSCGWFFSDVTGIETVQNLRYAARAIELAAPFAPIDLEAVVLEELGRAQSNADPRVTGRQLWEREVRPARVGVEHAAARLLLEALLGRESPRARHDGWALVAGPLQREPDGVLAGIRAESEATGEVVALAGGCRREGAFDFLAGVAPWSGDDWPRFAREAAPALQGQGAALDRWVARAGATLVRLGHFLPDEREALFAALTTEGRAALARDLLALSRGALPLAGAMAKVGVALPEWMRAVAAAAITQQFTDTLDRLGDEAIPARYVELLGLADQAGHLGVSLDLAAASARYAARLDGRLRQLEAGGAGWPDFLELLHIGTRLGLALPERGLQARVLAQLHALPADVATQVAGSDGAAYREIAGLLAVATRLNLRTDEVRERLRPIETQLAKDPGYWP